MLFFKNKKNKFWRNKNPKANRQNNNPESPNQRVISYYTASRRQLDNFERTSNLEQDNTLAKRRLGKIKKLWFVALLVIVGVSAVVYLGTLSGKPLVRISGPSYRAIADYQTIINNQFGSDFRNKIKPLLNSEKIQTKIIHTLPEVQSVKVSSSFLGHRPEVMLTIAKPLAIFAQDNQNNNLLISERGRILLETSKTKTNNTTLPILSNNSGIYGKAGEQFMRPDEAKALQELIKQHRANNLNNVLYSLTKIPHELQTKEQSRGYYVKYLLDDTITQQYGALLATQNELQRLSQQPSEYIDVRSIEKVYYK